MNRSEKAGGITEIKKKIKILHIDSDYKVTYFVNHPGSLIRSPLSLKKAIQLLKTEKFDLMIIEPLKKVFLQPLVSSEPKEV